MARRFGAPSAKEIIGKVMSNDPSLTEVNFTGNSIFQMKSTEKCKDLKEALLNNTVITSITLKNCDIADDGVTHIAEALEANNTIEVLDLSDNKIHDAGGIRLAEGISKNTGLRELNLMGMLNLGKSERVLQAFIDAFQQNLTLAKIVWRLDHRLAHTLARLVTRNNSIRHRIEQNKPFQDLVPDGLKEAHNVVLGRRGSTGTPAGLAADLAGLSTDEPQPPEPPVSEATPEADREPEVTAPEPEPATEPEAASEPTAASEPDTTPQNDDASEPPET